jgi:peptidoglycan/LPS O-acetylase OafA/YrhL
LDPHAIGRSFTPLQQSSPVHLPAIGALRGVAALYVALFHMTYVPSVHPAVAEWLLPFVTAGYSGVPLFFIISSFTLCHTMQGRRESHSTLRFYGRRLVRIVPLFYFVLLVTIARKALRHRFVSAPALLCNVSMLFNLVPGKEQGIVMASWSIGVEMLFYAAFPWLFRRVNSLGRAVVFFVAALAFSGVFSLIVERLPLSLDARINFFKFSVFRSLPCFAVGMIVYWFYRSRAKKPLSRAMGYWLVAAGGAGFFALVALNLNNSKPAFALHSVVYGLLVTGLLVTNWGVLVNRVTERLGDLSYSLYLWHPLVIVSVMGLYPRFYLRLPRTLAWFGCLTLTLSVLIPLAFLSYRFIEEPTRKAGSAFLKRWKATTLPGAHEA